MPVERDLVHLIVKRVLSTAFFIFVEPAELGLHALIEKTFLSRSKVDAVGDGFELSVEALIGPNLLSKMVLGFLGICPESGYDPSHDEMEDMSREFVNMLCGDLVTSMFPKGLRLRCSYSSPESEIGRFSISSVDPALGEPLCYSDLEGGSLCVFIREKLSGGQIG